MDTVVMKSSAGSCSGYLLLMLLSFHLILSISCVTDPDTEQARQLVEEINRFRISEGQSPLTSDPRLAEAAKTQVDYLLQMQPYCQCVDHEGPEGNSAADRVAAAGYAASCVGENLTSDADHPADAIQAWKNSASHRETMLGPEFVDLGVYIRGGLAAAVFACP